MISNEAAMHNIHGWRGLNSVGLWLFLCFASQPVYGEAGTIGIKMREHAEVDQARIRMSHIAECIGDTTVCEELYGVDVGPAPAPGKSMLLRIDDLKKILETEFQGKQFIFDRASVTRIVASGTDIDLDSIQRKLQQTINSLLSMEDGLRVVVNSLHLSSMGKARVGYSEVSFPDLDAIDSDPRAYLVSHLMGNPTIKVQLSAVDTEAESQVVWVRAQVEMEQQVPCAARDIENGTIIAADMVTTQWQKLVRTRQHVVQDIDSLLGKRVKSFVGMGSAFASGQVESPATIRRGMIINAEIRRGNMRVQSKAKALGNGATGDVLELSIVGSSRKLTGKVRGPELVEVNL